MRSLVPRWPSLIAIALLLPAAAAAALPPPGGGVDPWVDVAGDTMTGDLDLGSNSLQLAGGALWSTASNDLRFNGAKVCTVGASGCAGTTYTAGAGLQLTGTQFSVNTATVQSRVAGACAAGSAMRSIDAAGSVACEADDDTQPTGGAGIQVSGNVVSIRPAGVTSLELADGAAMWTKVRLFQYDIGAQPGALAFDTTPTDNTKICTTIPISTGGTPLTVRVDAGLAWTNATAVTTGGVAILRSADGGATWSATSGSVTPTSNPIGGWTQATRTAAVHVPASSSYTFAIAPWALAGSFNAASTRCNIDLIVWAS